MAFIMIPDKTVCGKEDAYIGVYEPDEKKEDETILITISAVGDCTLGVDYRFRPTFHQFYKKYGASYFFKKVKPVLGNDDITIANLEGALTSYNYPVEKSYNYKGPKKYANILKKSSVEVVTLANNHTKDYGENGFEDTKSALKDAGVKYCYKSTIAYKKISGIKVAFIGWNALEGVTAKQIQDSLKIAKKKGAVIRIVSFHWGKMYESTPNAKQKWLGHMAVDYGADLVIGHHAHVLQSIEKYKNAYIVYGLGNFVYGGSANPKDKDTMIFQQTFYVKKGKLLVQRDAKVIPCVQTTDSQSQPFQPTILKGTAKQRVIHKMNQLCKKYHVKIDKNGYLSD